MLKQCVLSPATLEVLLNSYTSVPPCEWMDSLSAEIYEVSSPRGELIPLVVPQCAVSCYFLPPFCLRTTELSSTWYVSGAASLALCSISVDALYVSI